MTRQRVNSPCIPSPHCVVNCQSYHTLGTLPALAQICTRCQQQCHSIAATAGGCAVQGRPTASIDYVTLCAACQQQLDHRCAPGACCGVQRRPSASIRAVHTSPSIQQDLHRAGMAVPRCHMQSRQSLCIQALSPTCSWPSPAASSKISCTWPASPASTAANSAPCQQVAVVVAGLRGLGRGPISMEGSGIGTAQEVRQQWANGWQQPARGETGSRRQGAGEPGFCNGVPIFWAHILGPARETSRRSRRRPLSSPPPHVDSFSNVLNEQFVHAPASVGRVCCAVLCCATNQPTQVAQFAPRTTHMQSQNQPQNLPNTSSLALSSAWSLACHCLPNTRPVTPTPTSATTAHICQSHTVPICCPTAAEAAQNASNTQQPRSKCPPCCPDCQVPPQ